MVQIIYKAVAAEYTKLNMDEDEKLELQVDTENSRKVNIDTETIPIIVISHQIINSLVPHRCGSNFKCFIFK